MKKIGLTLGKYAPFHKGHQYVIETALKEVDELFVLIYDTKVIDVPLTVRSNWIRTLYKDVKVIECWDGIDGTSNDENFKKMQEEYIIKMLNGQKITHFYSSEFYGEHVSKALNAIDRRIDEKREKIEISGTKIRENAYKYKDYLDEFVYKDLITKVVFVGAMSTGKSTITKEIAQIYNTNFASEYGRDYWEEHQNDRRIPLEGFNEIATIHIQKEDEALKDSNKYLFVDTNAVTTYMFSKDYHGKATKLVENLALENSRRYDIWFLCEDDIPYEDTWDRSGDQKREVFHKQIIADLKERRIPYISLKGDLDTRIKKVQSVLENFEKYNNFYGERV